MMSPFCKGSTQLSHGDIDDDDDDDDMIQKKKTQRETWKDFEQVIANMTGDLQF